MTSPQTTSQATELADKPVQSMDIWQAYAADQDEYQRCMDMLGDVPGGTLEARLTHYIGSYMALQLAASPDVRGAAIEALQAAEQELIDLARPLCCVFNRSTKQYEFTDAHIKQALPGTFAVLQQIRAALQPATPATDAARDALRAFVKAYSSQESSTAGLDEAFALAKATLGRVA